MSKSSYIWTMISTCSCNFTSALIGITWTFWHPSWTICIIKYSNSISMIITCSIYTWCTYPCTQLITNIFITLIIIYSIWTISWFICTCCWFIYCTCSHPCITWWMIKICDSLSCWTWSIDTIWSIPITLNI